MKRSRSIRWTNEDVEVCRTVNVARNNSIRQMKWIIEQVICLTRKDSVACLNYSLDGFGFSVHSQTNNDQGPHYHSPYPLPLRKRYGWILCVVSREITRSAQLTWADCYRIVFEIQHRQSEESNQHHTLVWSILSSSFSTKLNNHWATFQWQPHDPYFS